MAQRGRRRRGFDRALLLWRLESTAAATRFVETMLDEPSGGRR